MDRSDLPDLVVLAQLILVSSTIELLNSAARLSFFANKPEMYLLCGLGIISKLPGTIEWEQG